MTYENNKSSLTLFSDYKLSTNQFAISNEIGYILWSGKKDLKESQNRGELYAAQKALYLCSEIKKALSLKEIELTLKVDAFWLTQNSKRDSLAHSLTREAIFYGVKLNTVWVSSKDNLADKGTIGKKVKDFDIEFILEHAFKKKNMIQVADQKFHHVDLHFSYRIETNKFAITSNNNLLWGGRCKDIGEISQVTGERYMMGKIRDLAVKIKQHSGCRFLYITAKSDIPEIQNKGYMSSFISDLKKSGLFVKLKYTKNYENEAKVHTCRSKEEISKEIDVQEILKCVIEIDKRRVNEDFVEEGATTPVYQDSLF